MSEDRKPVYLKLLKYAENDGYIWVSPSSDTPHCDHGMEIPSSDIIGLTKIEAAITIAGEMSKTERFEFLIKLTRSILPEDESNKIFDTVLDKLNT